jgi:hypothetical protein
LIFFVADFFGRFALGCPTMNGAAHTMAKKFRREHPHIQLRSDTAVPRRDFAQQVGISDRTARRLNLPTMYMANVAYVMRNGSLEIVADRVKRRNSGAHEVRRSRATVSQPARARSKMAACATRHTMVPTP